MPHNTKTNSGFAQQTQCQTFSPLLFEGPSAEGIGGVPIHQNRGGEPQCLCHAPCVAQLDMEPKVIEENAVRTTRRGLFQYDVMHSTMTSQEGSANNWAFGYAHKAAQCRDAVLDMVQRELEACDCAGGLLLLHSLAGGTGSGVGAYFAAALRDELPHVPLLSGAVWPHRGGEVVLQGYNAVLCFAALQHAVDGLLVFDNDAVRGVCRTELRLARPCHADMNGVIARDLAGLLLPARHLTLPPAAAFGPAAALSSSRPPSPGPVRNSTQLQALARRRGSAPSPAPALPPSPEKPPAAAAAALGRPRRLFADLQRTLFAHPAYKCAALCGTPRAAGQHLNFAFQTWPSIVHHLRLTLRHGAAARERAPAAQGHNCVATALVLRGTDLRAPSGVDLTALATDPLLGPAPDGTGLGHVAASPQPFSKYSRYGCAAANSQAIVPPVQAVLAQAAEQYGAGAYLHHFAKYGVEGDTFEDSFTVLQRVLQDYRGIPP